MKINFFFSFLLALLANSFNEKKLFESNCSICHPIGKNLILPEKDLKKENLESNGMNSISSIRYQIKNGKNGMPAFGDRLKEKEIEKIAEYVLFQASRNFEKD